MNVRCPHCAVITAVDEELADQEVLCDQCGRLFVVRPIPPPLPAKVSLDHTRRDEPSFSLSAEQRAAIWKETRPFLPYLGAVAAFFVWVNTACLKPGPTQLWNYGAVIAFGAFATAIMQLRFGKTPYLSRAIGWGGVVFTFALLFTWNRFDFWQERVDLKGGGFVDYYYRRWSTAPFYKYISKGVILEGYCSDSGKPHGKWEMINWSPYSHTQVYYWYGEEITEGEWHLRNK